MEAKAMPAIVSPPATDAPDYASGIALALVLIALLVILP